MSEPAEQERIDPAVVLRFVDVATDALAAAREEIDDLNVYPVPDGDTGTNMYLTLSAARDAVRALPEVAAGEPGERQHVLGTMARGALLGARGNSGVILSEMLGAIARRTARAGTEERNATVVADALHDAVVASYRAVGEPVEGTMLTVATAAAEAAATAATRPGARSRDVFAAAAAAAREALLRTPDQLAVLRESGVVDAGGRGITVILDAADVALTGRRQVERPRTRFTPRPAAEPAPTPSASPSATPSASPLATPSPAFEVMYLLDTTAAGEAGVADLRTRLAALGDSLVVVGGEGLWNVHVHVDDAGAAVEAGLAAGRPHRVRITHLPSQTREHAASPPSTDPEPRVRPGRRTRAVVAVAAGPGLRALFEEAGAVVVEGGPGRRPATGELLAAVTGSGAGEVVLLPNDADSLRVATVAASTAEADHGIAVAVVPTVAQVQGLAAIAVHDPGRSFERDVLEMTATARHARHGAVTLAARRALTMAGWCEPGDVLGVVEGDFVAIGSDLERVAADVLARLLAPGGELVTIVTGADDGAAALAAALAASVAESHAHVDVVVHDGGQARYPLLVCVE